MPVTTIHPDYEEYQPQWRLVRDASAGDPAVKKRGTVYLPADFADSEPDRYATYKDRAYFLGVTGRTEEAMTGMVFRKEPSYELPSALESLLGNIDGAGNSIEQVAKDGLAGMLETRRHLFLTDYPSIDPNIDAETERALGLRPVITQYAAESLINWRFDNRSGQSLLSLAVLKEEINKSEDEFAHEPETQYRVLRLRVDGYTQEVVDLEGNIISPEFYPTMSGGQRFNYIPLFGVRKLETPPLYDIARVNIAHYCNTADVEDAGYIVGQPMLHINSGDTSAQEWNETNGKVGFGVRTGIVTQNGSIELVQAAENNLGRQLKLDKENEMTMLGAQLIIRGGQAETAEAARIRAGAESSVLDTLTNDLSEDIESALKAMAQFLGENPDGVEFRLSTDFFEAGLNPQTLQALLQARTVGVIGKTDVRNMMRKGRVELVRDDESIDIEVAEDLLNEPEAQPINPEG